MQLLLFLSISYWWVVGNGGTIPWIIIPFPYSPPLFTTKHQWNFQRVAKFIISPLKTGVWQREKDWLLIDWVWVTKGANPLRGPGKNKVGEPATSTVCGCLLVRMSAFLLVTVSWWNHKHQPQQHNQETCTGWYEQTACFLAMLWLTTISNKQADTISNQGVHPNMKPPRVQPLRQPGGRGPNIRAVVVGHSTEIRWRPSFPVGKRLVF